METCDSLFEQALRFLDEQKYREAYETFTDFIALCPTSEGAYGNRGLALLQLGDDSAALSDFRTVVELNPDDAQGFSMMAEALRNLGRYDDALQAAAEALEISENELIGRYVRGWLFARGEQYACAAEDLAVYVEGCEDPAEAKDLLQVCRELAGMEPLDEAIDIEDPESRLFYLEEMGFSFDFSYNKKYEEDGMFCPYAHCLRNMPQRADEAPATCIASVYECPGGYEQVCHCRENPPEL